MPVPWTTEEIEKLATAVYKRGVPRCPRCSNPIRSAFTPELDSHGDGRRTMPVDLTCVSCGLQDRYDPIELEYKDLQWTTQEKQTLARQYRRQRRSIPCPKDGAYLVDMPGRENGDFFKLHCPRCGRYLVSTEVT